MTFFQFSDTVMVITCPTCHSTTVKRVNGEPVTFPCSNGLCKAVFTVTVQMQYRTLPPRKRPPDEEQAEA